MLYKARMKLISASLLLLSKLSLVVSSSFERQLEEEGFQLVKDDVWIFISESRTTFDEAKCPSGSYLTKLDNLDVVNYLKGVKSILIT